MRQRKTGRLVKFEITEQIRQAIDVYFETVNKKQGSIGTAAAA